MAESILLIDDDPGYLKAVVRLLEGAGYCATAASSAADARGKLKEARYDLILLDVIMPAEDGLTFADELAKMQDVADVPVVLVTAVAEHPGQILQAFSQDKGLTAVDVLPKSQVHERLLDCVAAALPRQKNAATTGQA